MPRRNVYKQETSIVNYATVLFTGFLPPFSKPETDNTNLFAFSESFALESLFDDNKEN